MVTGAQFSNNSIKIASRTTSLLNIHVFKNDIADYIPCEYLTLTYHSFPFDFDNIILTGD